MVNLERKFEFASGREDEDHVENPFWKVLTVEDDAAYQASLVFALRSMKVQKKQIRLLTAQSTTEATRIISRNPDIAVILLDVVMEHDDSGLTLVKTVRELYANVDVRIILLTGQPGMVPQRDVMTHYDIDDYWCKSELTNDHLSTIITSNIRTWDHLVEIRKSRTGLQRVINASKQLSGKRDVNEFLKAILEQIGTIFEVETSLICTVTEYEPSARKAVISSATGEFSRMQNQPLELVGSKLLVKGCEQVLMAKHHVFIDEYSFLYIRYSIELTEYIVILKNDMTLSKIDIHLLQIFFENISVGLDNISLYNRLLRLAYYDPVLNMPNRNWLAKEIAKLNVTQEGQSELFIIDVDDFASIGITFGNSFCDQLIKCVHALVLSRIPESAQISRIGMSSIGILINQNSLLNARFFESLFTHPLNIDHVEHTISITVAKVDLSQTGGYLSSEQIVRRGESLVELARQKGRHFIENDADLEKEVTYRHSMLDDLRKAFLQNQFFIVLQPKIRLADQSLTGYEALARWRKPDGSIVSPAEFIPLAEASGLIGRLDNRVLELTCQAVKKLNQKGIFVPVSFNACSSELMSHGYIDNLKNIIQKFNVDPRLLELEVTESQAAPEYRKIAGTLEKVMALGMDVSIDDFGTGYSSLAHVTDLKATTIKIDQIFVRRLNISSEHDYVINMMLDLGKKLGFKVIAEGIETEAQKLMLLNKGCEFGQGYLFSKPLPVNEAIEYSRKL